MHNNTFSRTYVQSTNVYDIYKMETFFMNSKNSKTNESYRFKYDLIDKLDLKNPNKNMALGNLSTYPMDRIIYQKYKIILNI